MVFRTNGPHQLNFEDRFLTKLTEREQQFVLNSWAYGFGRNVFPNIDEETFSVLYCDNNGKPNTPINVIIGALLIKEMFGMTDDEVVEAVILDPRFHYALHLTSFAEIPFSDRTLSRFRERVYKYELETGTDLLKIEMKSIANCFAKYLEITPKAMRMDTLMIASLCKDMGRLELICTVVQNLVKTFVKFDCVDKLPDSLKIYLEKDNKNAICYHEKDIDNQTRLETLIKDAFLIYSLCDEKYYDNEDYLLMKRLLDDQTKKIDGETVIKENKEIEPDSLQNPSDPDATYRHKAGDNYTGYTGNIVEICGDEGNLIIDFDYKQNTHSDVEFGKDAIDALGEQDKNIPLIADGGFASKDNFELAEENNMELVATNLTGKIPDEVVADFVIDEENKTVVSCPSGEKPTKCTYDENTGIYNAQFDKNKCENCPLKDNCGVKIKKKVATVRITANTVERASYAKNFNTEKFKELARKRNGVEGVMSELRRRYNVDNIPVAGLLRSKIWFTLKIGALNSNRMIRIMKKREKVAIA